MSAQLIMQLVQSTRAGLTWRTAMAMAPLSYPDPVSREFCLKVSC